MSAEHDFFVLLLIFFLSRNSAAMDSNMFLLYYDLLSMCSDIVLVHKGDIAKGLSYVIHAHASFTNTINFYLFNLCFRIDLDSDNSKA